MKRIALFAFVLSTACATGSSPSAAVTTTDAPTTTGTPPTTSAVETTQGPGGDSTAIGVSDFAFSPSNVTVKVGASVTWNLTEGAHTATSGTAPEGDGIFNETLEANAPFSFTFAEAGDYRFFCRFHPDFMTGTVIVEP